MTPQPKRIRLQGADRWYCLLLDWSSVLADLLFTDVPLFFPSRLLVRSREYPQSAGTSPRKATVTASVSLTPQGKQLAVSNGPPALN